MFLILLAFERVYFYSILWPSRPRNVCQRPIILARPSRKKFAGITRGHISQLYVAPCHALPVSQSARLAGDSRGRRADWVMCIYWLVPGKCRAYRYSRSANANTYTIQHCKYDEHEATYIMFIYWYRTFHYFTPIPILCHSESHLSAVSLTHSRIRRRVKIYSPAGRYGSRFLRNSLEVEFE